MAVMMYRSAMSGSAGLPYTEEEIQSARDWAERGAEVAIGDWVLIPAQYRESVTFCFRCGLLEGMDSLGSFNGEDTVTRAQAAAVLCRVLDAKEGPEDSAAGAAPRAKALAATLSRAVGTWSTTCAPGM